MWELQFVAVHEDGEHLVVRCPELDDEELLLPITDELRDAVAAPARSVSREPLGDQPLTPREIQTRVRAGESPEELARAAGVPLPKVERFAGPVLAERAHVATEARRARLTGTAADEGAAALGEVVAQRLEGAGVDAESVTWDAWRRDDGVWMLQVSYLSDGERQTAEWSWDPARHQLRAYGAAARSLSGAPAAASPMDSVALAPGLRMVPPRRDATAARDQARPVDAAATDADPQPGAEGRPGADAQSGADANSGADAQPGADAGRSAVVDLTDEPAARAEPADGGASAGVVLPSADQDSLPMEVDGLLDAEAAPVAATAGALDRTAGDGSGGGTAGATTGEGQHVPDRRRATGRQRGKRRDEPAAADDGDGVTRRAVVPSWEDILFGVRRER